MVWLDFSPRKELPITNLPPDLSQMRDLLEDTKKERRVKTGGVVLCCMWLTWLHMTEIWSYYIILQCIYLYIDDLCYFSTLLYVFWKPAGDFSRSRNVGPVSLFAELGDQEVSQQMRSFHESTREVRVLVSRASLSDWRHESSFCLTSLKKGHVEWFMTFGTLISSIYFELSWYIIYRN